MRDDYTYDLPDGEVSVFVMYKWVETITTQAELKDITWGVRFHGPTDQRKASIEKHTVKVKHNRSKLEAWVGRVRPKGEAMIVARYIYRQYNAEMKRLREVCEANGLDIDEIGKDRKG